MGGKPLSPEQVHEIGQDMLQRALNRNLEFLDTKDQEMFHNQLVNPHTLSEWIKCAFNGNVLEM